MSNKSVGTSLLATNGALPFFAAFGVALGKPNVVSHMLFLISKKEQAPKHETHLCNYMFKGILASSLAILQPWLNHWALSTESSMI